jgi:hypothetical protein
LRDNDSTGITVATCAQQCVERRQRETARKHTCMDGLGRERVPRYAHAPAKLSPRVGAASCAAVPRWREQQQQSRRLRFVCVWRACMHHPSDTWKHRRRKGLCSLRANRHALLTKTASHRNIYSTKRTSAISYQKVIAQQPRDSGHWYRHHSTWQTRVARRDRLPLDGLPFREPERWSRNPAEAYSCQEG